MHTQVSFLFGIISPHHIGFVASREQPGYDRLHAAWKLLGGVRAHSFCKVGCQVDILLSSRDPNIIQIQVELPIIVVQNQVQNGVRR